jgi:hypothetical protein
VLQDKGKLMVEGGIERSTWKGRRNFGSEPSSTSKTLDRGFPRLAVDIFARDSNSDRTVLFSIECNRFE